MFYKGFTLIECLVAIGILIIGVLGAFTLTIRSLSMSPLIADNFSASLYSQQGIEAIIYLRNNNWLEGKDWSNDLIGNWCITINENGSVLKSSSSVPCSIGSTNFSRSVSVEVSRISDNELKVISSVKWPYKGRNYSVSNFSYLTNWAGVFFK